MHTTMGAESSDSTRARDPAESALATSGGGGRLKRLYFDFGSGPSGTGRLELGSSVAPSPCTSSTGAAAASVSLSFFFLEESFFFFAGSFFACACACACVNTGINGDVSVRVTLYHWSRWSQWYPLCNGHIGKHDRRFQILPSLVSMTNVKRFPNRTNCILKFR